MIRKAIIVLVALLLAVGGSIALYARHVLSSDHLRATLESQLAARFGQPVRIGRVGASLFPRIALELGDIAVGDPATATIARASVSTGLRGLISRRVEEAEVLLADGRISLPAVAAIAAAAAAPAPGGAAGGPTLTIVSVRRMAFENVDVVAGAATLRVNMESGLTGDRLAVSRLTAESTGTRLTATGELSSLGAMQGRFTVTADRLDLDEVLSIASASAPAQPGGRRAPAAKSAMRLAIDMTAPAGRLAGYEFTDLTAAIVATPALVRMGTLALRIFDGAFKGSLDVDSSGDPPRLHLQGRVEGVDVARLAAEAGTAGSISGRLGGSLAIDASGTDPDTMLRTARGSAAAAITGGAIPGLDMVRTIVLAFGKPSGAPPPGSGSAFSRLGGDFRIHDGVISTANLDMASRDFDMRGRATLVARTGAIDALADVVLSKELTAQAGTDLRRYAQADGRVIVPAHITGTLSRPSITLDLAAAMRRALENELKRRTKSLLEDLFKRKKGGPGGAGGAGGQISIF